MDAKHRCWVCSADAMTDAELGEALREVLDLCNYYLGELTGSEVRNGEGLKFVLDYHGIYTGDPEEFVLYQAQLQQPDPNCSEDQEPSEDSAMQGARSVGIWSWGWLKKDSRG